MGQFSWKSSDTRERILHSESPSKTVYMLNPNGKNFKETSYAGYGEFGGLDAYVFLCEINCPELKDKDEKYKREMGLALDLGNIYLDEKTGKYYGFQYKHLLEEVSNFDGNYAQEMSEYGKTPNALIKEKVWTVIPFKDLFLKGKEYLPLKFSFKDIDYQDVGPAESDPYQGY